MDFRGNWLGIPSERWSTVCYMCNWDGDERSDTGKGFKGKGMEFKWSSKYWTFFLFWFLMSVRCWGVCSGRPYNFGLWPRWNYAFILIAQLQKNAVQCRFLPSNLLQGLSYRRLASTHYVVSWASSGDQTLQVELHVFSTDERTLKNEWTSFIISALRRYVGYKIPTDILMLEVSIFNNSTKCLVELSATLPETNIAPENGEPLEKEIPIGDHHF